MLPAFASTAPLPVGVELVEVPGTRQLQGSIPAGQLLRLSTEGVWLLEDVPAPEAVPEPAPQPPAEPSPEERVKALQTAVQGQLDAVARALGYDGIFTAVTYADEPAVPRFQAEGQALRAWRSQVWAACYSVLAAVQAGEREEPTMAELVAELPAFVAPAPVTAAPEAEPAGDAAISESSTGADA
ncbi:MAG: hypothetical protein KBC94_23375 [Pseudacidovorax sp.]|uniref:hypothetical protein n=1 Tax=Pseudacidovorax sp. TaxID=1934311 RepID=UPI001B40EB16|nr:hypothetical protein [Pseudacidovorax sp.]MBP6897369.1 hypothetical protein [Pseudacidovorax sp.]